jgi:hypothetical protein
MSAEGNVKKGTKQFMRQGHTTVNAFGANVTIDAHGTAGETPKEIKP